MAEFILVKFDEGFIKLSKTTQFALERISPEDRIIIAPLSYWGIRYALDKACPEYYPTTEEIGDAITALLNNWNWTIDPRNEYRWDVKNSCNTTSMAEEFICRMEQETGRNWHRQEHQPTLSDLLKQKIEDNDDMF